MVEPNIIIIDWGLTQERVLTNMSENDNTVINYIRDSRMMTELVIRNAGMMSCHLHAICEDKDAVKKMRSLEKLDLSHNHLTDEDIKMLTEFMRNNCRKMKNFNVRGNSARE
ncbi:hypothetical protein BGX28_003790 [Mortierella sp. GBA30]|nr:hypothetical protein BGX28_003790 [Mortierella sp. GBA30]